MAPNNVIKLATMLCWLEEVNKLSVATGTYYIVVKLHPFNRRPDILEAENIFWFSPAFSIIRVSSDVPFQFSCLMCSDTLQQSIARNYWQKLSKK